MNSTIQVVQNCKQLHDVCLISYLYECEVTEKDTNMHIILSLGNLVKISFTLKLMISVVSNN